LPPPSPISPDTDGEEEEVWRICCDVLRNFVARARLMHGIAAIIHKTVACARVHIHIRTHICTRTRTQTRTRKHAHARAHTHTHIFTSRVSSRVRTRQEALSLCRSHACVFDAFLVVRASLPHAQARETTKAFVVCACACVHARTCQCAMCVLCVCVRVCAR